MAAHNPIFIAARPLRRKVGFNQACHACHRIQPFSSSTRAQGRGSNGEGHMRQQLFRDPKWLRSSENQSPGGTLSKLKTLTRAELPDDIGLCPETFVKPIRSNRPSWFKEPKKRLHLEYYWVKNRVQSLGSVYIYCKHAKPAPKLPLGLRERRSEAIQLYQRFYKAIAEGDRDFIRDNCCTNLANSILTDLSRRPANQKRTWKLASFRGIGLPSFISRFSIFPFLTPYTAVRVVSDRAVGLPFGNASGIRQIVVRISTKQELTVSDARIGPTNVRATTRGNVPIYQPPPTEPSDAKTKSWSGTEYFVLQKMRHEGEQDEKWAVWGTIQPEENWDQYLENLKKLKETDQGESMMDNVRSMMPGVGGGGGMV